MYKRQVFDGVVASNDAWLHFLEKPKAWGELSADQRSWFSPWNATALFPDGVDASTCAGMTYEEYAADPVPCCDAATGSETKWALGQLAADFITSRDVCECWGAEWDVVVSQSFDNVILAFLSLFEIATTEGWVDVMYAACLLYTSPSPRD